MDSNLLVERGIEDGAKLIRQLIRDQFPVEVALWVKINEDGLWRLYMASSLVDPKNFGETLRIVYAALDKIPHCSITPSEITLLNAGEAIARDAVKLRDRYPGDSPKPLRGLRLGNTTTHEVYVYPWPFPMKVRQMPEG